jgi:TATA-box binding protein (TBP) (component of TFIID and TFIIIB)
LLAQVYSTQMPINLERLSLLLKNSTYDKKKFAAITIRYYAVCDHQVLCLMCQLTIKRELESRTCNPFCTALLFTSGKLVVTGVQSFYECILASLSIMNIINMVYPLQAFRVYNCVVQNIVAHSTFNLQIHQKFDIQVGLLPLFSIYFPS